MTYVRKYTGPWSKVNEGGKNTVFDYAAFLRRSIAWHKEQLAEDEKRLRKEESKQGKANDE